MYIIHQADIMHRHYKYISRKKKICKYIFIRNKGKRKENFLKFIYVLLFNIVYIFQKLI